MDIDYNYILHNANHNVSVSFLDAAWEDFLARSAFGNNLTGDTATSSWSDVQASLPSSRTRLSKGPPAPSRPTDSAKCLDDEAEAAYPYEPNLTGNVIQNTNRNKGRGKQKLMAQNQTVETSGLNSDLRNVMRSTVFPRMEPENLPSLFPELQIGDGPVPYENDIPKFLRESETQDFLIGYDHIPQRSSPETLDDVDPSGDEVELENTESRMGFRKFVLSITLFAVLGLLMLSSNILAAKKSIASGQRYEIAKVRAFRSREKKTLRIWTSRPNKPLHNFSRKSSGCITASGTTSNSSSQRVVRRGRPTLRVGRQR